MKWLTPHIALVFTLLAVIGASPEPEKESEKHKRQIFREQVLPHSGGKIPEDAFRADRLALNKLNKDGISVPDGILLEARRHEKHPYVRHNSDLERSVIKVVLSSTPEENRYVAPEGRYHYPRPVTIDSTYIIRPPIGTYKQEFRPHRPVEPRRPIPVPLQLPSPVKPPQRLVSPPPPSKSSHVSLYNSGGYLFQSAHGLLADSFYPFYTPQKFAAEFEAFFEHFEDHGRLIRQSPVHIQHSQDSKIPGAEGKDYPSYSEIPETRFDCSNYRFKDKMYADPQTGCQVFHLCQKDGRRDSFLCPKGTVFNEVLSHCDWWYNVKCS